MAAPQIGSWSWQNLQNGRAGDFLRQCANPLSRELVEPILAYRVATPVIAWILHLGPIAALSLQYIFSILTLALCHRFLRRRLSSRGALFLTLAFACSSAIQFPNWLPGIPDSLTHLAAIIALSFRPAGVVFSSVFVGIMNDERMLLALPFIALWKLRCQTPLDSFRPFSQATWPLFLAVVAGFSLRYTLKVGWIGPPFASPPLYSALATQFLTGMPWLGSWAIWSVNLLNGPRWLWLIPAALPLFTRDWPRRVRLTLFLFSFLGPLLGSFIVADAARTFGFAFPAFLIGAVWLAEDAPKTTERLFFCIGILQIITPCLWIYQNWQRIQFLPLPWELKIFFAR